MSVTEQPSIGLVSFDSLGDSLLYLMLADNLARNQLAITLYGTVAYQLAAWLPHLNIQPYPSEEGYQMLAQKYDLVIVSPPSTIRKRFIDDPAYLAWARSQWILLCQKSPEAWHFNHYDKLVQVLDNKKINKLKPFLQFGHSVRYKKFTTESLVEITLAFMREKLNLSNVKKEVQLTPPSHLVYRKHSRRVIVSPDSAGPSEKEWSPSRFIALCDALNSQGYTTQIVVAPKNIEHWKSVMQGTHEVLTFPSIGLLAEHLYESSLVVCNDSGNAHLASFLNIPTVVVYRKRNPLYHWRPGWRAAHVVTPNLSFSGINKHLWKVFTPVSKVEKAVIASLDAFNKSAQ